MLLKELIRPLTKKNVYIEKLWLYIQWKVTDSKYRKYSDLEYTNILWKQAKNRKPNLENPVTYDEKMWLLKLSNRDPLLTMCSDKHLVRTYIKECGYKDILKKEYAVFEDARDIDFDSIPSPCYLKMNNASGMNCVFDREKSFNKKQFIWKFNFLKKQHPYYLSREWNYKNIKPLIICEELLEMPDGYSDIPELQFFCFHGNPKFIMYNLGLADSEGNHKQAIRWVFDMNWNIIDVETSMPTSDIIPEMPENYSKMVEIAKKLSEPFPHVRVDLFNIEGKIYFNELTFYSGGGFVHLKPDEWQYKIGAWINCKDYIIADDAKTKHNR